MVAIQFLAHTEKNRKPYTVNVGERHHKVLKELSYYPSQGRTDAELVFGLRLHQAGARRCELRDLGAVRRAGRSKGSWCWKLTQRGYDILHDIEDDIRNTPTTSEVSA